MAIGQSEKDRFRSFAERYVIERAGHWKPGEEDTGAWASIQDAKRVYHQIALAGEYVQEHIAQAIEHAAKTQGALQGGNAAQQAQAPTTGQALTTGQLQNLATHLLSQIKPIGANYVTQKERPKRTKAARLEERNRR